MIFATTGNNLAVVQSSESETDFAFALTYRKRDFVILWTDVEEVDQPVSKKGDDTAEVIDDDDDDGDDDVLMTLTESKAKSDDAIINVSSADSVTFQVGDDDMSVSPVVIGEEKTKKSPAKRKRAPGKARAKKPKTG